jgi:hypothetical protein
MAKTKISEFSTTAADNTDINNINIAEGCSPANVNNAIRSLMSVLKNFEDGSSGDNVVVGGNLSVTGTTTLTGTAIAPTPSPGDNSTKIATTAFVNTKVGTVGTMASQNASAVAITGGTITGITDLTVADGGTGASSITANSVILGNGTSALSGNLVAPGTSGNVLSSNGTTWTSAALNKLTPSTEQATTSGTSVTFSSIPSWVKRITVIFNEVSGNGSSNLQVRVGAGSTTTTGYISTGINMSTTGGVSSSTSAFYIRADDSAYINSGTMTLVNVSGNTWISNHLMKTSTSQLAFGAGSVSLSGTLDRVVISFANGTDAFDAGSVNIFYE